VKVSETQPPKRITLGELPRSPRVVAHTALDCGWDVRAWLSIVEAPPTYYVNSSEENAAGDVKIAGHLLRMITVEARDPNMPLGFKANYISKSATGASFQDALVVDPVGIPRELRADYKAMKQVRAKYETSESIKLRTDDVIQRADLAKLAYNDGGFAFFNQARFSAARDLDAWLAEWQSFSAIKEGPK